MNWDRRLVEWAESVRGRPFVWGETDCATLVRGAVEAMYGPAFLAGIAVPEYGTQVGAERAWDQTGGTAAVLVLLGAQELPDGERQRGDVLLVAPGALEDTQFESAFVVVGREMVGVFVGEVVRTWPADAMPLEGRARLLRLP